MTFEKIYSDIKYEYDASTFKHPFFAETYTEAATILNEELGEYAEEVCKGNRKRALVELKQVASVCIRFVEMIYLKEKNEQITFKDVFDKTNQIKPITYDVWYANLAVLTTNVGKINKYVYENLREDSPVEKIIDSILYTITICQIVLKNNCK